jgi:glycosyltransferase involved in cell wall biosynthesis
MPPVKLFYFITNLELGGAQTVLVHLMRRLDRSRFDPTVVCLYGSDTPAGAAIREANVPVIDLQMTHKWRFDAFWRLYKLLRRQRPAILHNILFHAVLPGRILGRLAGTPLILSWRQNVELGSKLRDWLNRWTIALDDQVVAVSEAVRQAEIECSHISSSRITSIPNFVDATQIQRQSVRTDRLVMRQTLGLSQDRFVIGNIGRLHTQKGLAFLLNAMPAIQKIIPEVCLLLVGDGELRHELEVQARKLDLKEAVLFLGARDDVPQLLTTLDLFVLPSLWEGLPLAVLEAMAVGLPVVATDVGGTAAAVLEGVTGRLVPPRDTPALAQAIIQLGQNPALCRQMGQAGFAHVQENFTVDRAVTSLMTLYQTLLGNKSP